MQSFDTDSNNTISHSETQRQQIEIAKAAEIAPGDAILVELPTGEKLAVYNVSGEFYAIDYQCPHRGASLVDGHLCGYIVECSLHGWQFDVRTGECLTVLDRIKTYQVVVEDGVSKLVL
jgi:3-phenylpropionate/trans-cinnamate dioxygenase ferredoxin component